jgi:hypothetical protein
MIWRERLTDERARQILNAIVDAGNDAFFTAQRADDSDEDTSKKAKAAEVATLRAEVAALTALEGAEPPQLRDRIGTHEGITFTETLLGDSHVSARCAIEGRCCYGERPAAAREGAERQRPQGTPDTWTEEGWALRAYEGGQLTTDAYGHPQFYTARVNAEFDADDEYEVVLATRTVTVQIHEPVAHAQTPERP